MGQADNSNSNSASSLLPPAKGGRATTAKLMSPCVRNTFMLARADRNDGYKEDDLEVHYGQAVNILANMFLSDEVLYLHMEGATDAYGKSIPSFVPRSARQALWRIMPAPRSTLDRQPETELERAAQDLLIPRIGQVLRVNERVSLQSVRCGR